MDLNELYADLEAADSSGDTKLATHIAGLIKQQQPQQQVAQAPEQPGNPYGGVRQLLQGLTFGASDEIGAAVAAIPASIGDAMNGRGFDPVGVYRDMHGSLADERSQYKEESPKTALAAELVGGIATGGVGAAKMAGTKIVKNLPNLWKYSAIGATEGGIYGAASSDIGERAKGGATGAAIGGTLGPVVQYAGRVGSHLARPAIDRGIKALSSTPAGDARRFLADSLSREGVDHLDDLGVQAQGKGREMATIADLSQGGRGALEGLVNDVSNPNIRALADNTLKARNNSQMSRAMNNLDQGLELPAEATIKQAMDAVKTQRSETANELYGKVKGQPLRATDTIKRIIKDETVESALTEAQKRLNTKRINDEVISQIDIFDETKKILDDDIGALMRTGKKNRAGDLIKMKNTLLDEIDKQIPDYKAARSAYAGDSALLDAGEFGKRVFKEDLDHMDDIISGMGDSEKVMFRLGVKKAAREKMMGAREGNNTITRIMSELNLEKISKAFPDNQSFNKFKSDLKFEMDIFDTSQVLHNSKTALRQAAQREISGGGDGILDAMGTSNTQKLANAVDRIMNKGLSSDAKEELGKMLLSPLKDLPKDTVSGLNKALAKKTKSPKKAAELLEQWQYTPISVETAGQGIYAQ